MISPHDLAVISQALPSISPDRPSSSLKAVGNAVSGCLSETLRNLFDLAGSLSYAKVRTRLPTIRAVG